MARSKSNAKKNWFARLWNARGIGAALRNRRRNANKLRLEQLELRRLLAAILLDIPGINGDATGAGATATDIQLAEFSWGFSRGDEDANSNLNDPIVFSDLKFTKPVDSASNDLYSQASYAPIYSTATKLRLVDDVVTPGKNLLSFELGSGRLTSFSTNGQSESGSLSFAKVDFNESLATIDAVTNRTASWDLLNGAVAKSAITGPGNIDNSKNNQPSSNPLNIETVLEIGGQKLLIDDFSWSAATAGNVLALPGSLTKAKGSGFQITRNVDSGTAGLLGSAAAGTNLGKVTITDRATIAGVNKVFMQWNLYDAFISEFGLSVKASELATNKLGLSYSKIELSVTEFNKNTGVPGKTLTTIWDEANNVVTPAVDFGTADPLLADAAFVASYLDFGTLGRVRYNEIDWSVSKPTTIDGSEITQGKTTLGPASVTLAAGPSTPALLGSLAKLSVLPTVAAKEQDKSDVTSVLDTWTLTNAAVTNFAISSEGLDAPVVEFDLDFQSSTEAYNARNIPLIARGNFNEVTQTSTGAVIFGVEVPTANPNFDFEFELEITQTVNGKSVKTEIPVTIAEWAANRDIFRNPANGNVSGGTLAAGTFDLSIPRGIHSPGLFAAAARGTKIESAVVRRYDTVGKGQIELYRWELTNAFLTSYASHRLPGNSAEEVDRISFNPSKIALVNAKNKGGTSYDFITAKPGGGGSIENPLAGSSTVLQAQIDGLGTNFFAIDSFSWGAKLPVDATTTSGERPLGNPDALDLTLNVTGLPSPALLNKLFVGTAIAKTKLKLPADNNSPGTDYIATLTDSVFATGYSYKDELTSTAATNSLSLFPGNKAELGVRPVNAQGQPGTPRVATWDLKTDQIAAKPSFGGFQFAPNESPDTVLEFFDGTTRGQVILDSYAFGTANKVEQAVGKSGSPATIAARGISTPGAFSISTRMDETTPGLLAAIALKTKLPEVKIIERANLIVGGISQFVPVREWTLRDVYIEDLANAAEVGDAQASLGTIKLALNPGSAESTLITYGKDSKAIRAERKIDFVTPPFSTGDVSIARRSSDTSQTLDLTQIFSDTSESAATLRYSVAFVSGSTMFSSVVIDNNNSLILNYNSGQLGTAQLRVFAMDSLGLVGSTNVAVSSSFPAGTSKSVSINEDATYTLTASDFGFSDPTDTPPDTFAGIRVSPTSVGTLTLNDVPVFSSQISQFVSVAEINAGLLRYTPPANINGNSIASFLFQVQDSGSETTNLDPIGNQISFDVLPVNDAPTLSVANVALTDINEDTTSPAGTLVSALLSGVSDVDANAARGMAVQSVQNLDGAWQYSLNNGALWQPLSSVTSATARLLPSNARVRFVPVANFAGQRSIQFSAWDQTTGVAGDTTDLSLPTAVGGSTAFSSNFALAQQTVRAVNDAPTIVMQNTATVAMGSPLVFANSPNSPIRIADIDAGTSQIQAAFTATSGRFTLSTLTGITVTAGTNGSAAFTVRGTVAAMNTALQNSSFTANPGFFGIAQLRLNVSDLGNTGNGGVKTASRTTVISVQPISLGALTAANPTVIAKGSAPAVSVASQVYTFSTAATSDVRVALSGVTSTVNMFLLNSAGQNLGQTTTLGTANRTILAAALPAGTYTLSVVPNGVASDFDLAVSIAATSDDLIVNARDLGVLNAAKPTARVFDSVNGTGDRQDYYKFTNAVAGPLRVNLSGLSDDYDLQLLNSSGILISSSALPGTRIETIARSNLPAGTFFIRVFALPNRTLSTYDLSVTVATTSDDTISRVVALGTLDAATLPIVRTTSTLAPSTDIQDYYSFAIASTSSVRINLSGLSTDADINFLDAFGRVLASSRNGGNSIEDINLSNLIAGTYYVRASLFNIFSTSYELAIALNPASDDLITNAVDLGSLSATVPTIQRTGDVNSTSDLVDYYRFTLGATSDVRVNLSGMSGDADVTLEDSFGKIITDSLFGGNLIDNLSATALAAGTYHIRVNTLSATTNYLLAVSQTPASDDLISNATILSALTSGTSPTARTSGSVGASDIQDYYRFQLNTAGNLRLNLSGMTTDLDVQILDQFGQVIVFGAQSGNTIERVTTPELAVGTYYIRVFQLFVGASSNYILEISRDFNGDDLVRGGNNLGTLASTALTASGAVGGAADIQDYYSVTLTSTRNVRFLLTGLTADIDLQILDSFGRLIQAGTSGSTTTEDLTVTGLVAGQYFIRVFPFNTAVSNYFLSVTGVTAPALPAAMPAAMSAASLPPSSKVVADETGSTVSQEKSVEQTGNSLDVNGDGAVTPLDALLVVNALRAKANGELTTGGTDVDMNRDGVLSPIDALLVINSLNSRQAAAPGEGEERLKRK